MRVIQAFEEATKTLWNCDLLDVFNAVLFQIAPCGIAAPLHPDELKRRPAHRLSIDQRGWSRLRKLMTGLHDLGRKDKSLGLCNAWSYGAKGTEQLLVGASAHLFENFVGEAHPNTISSTSPTVTPPIRKRIASRVIPLPRWSAGRPAAAIPARSHAQTSSCWPHRYSRFSSQC